MADPRSPGFKRSTDVYPEQDGKELLEVSPHRSAAGGAAAALQDATDSLRTISKQSSYSGAASQYPNRRTGNFNGQMMPLPPKAPSFHKEKVQ